MKRFRFSLVLLLGALLLGVGVIGLTLGPSLMQYAFLPPADMSGILTTYTELQTSLQESFPTLSLHGIKNGVSLSLGNKAQNDVTLYLAGPGYQEVYPRRYLSGRPVSRVDIERSSPVIVLDQETAFLFFGEKDPIGQTVSLDGLNVEVIGVAAHSRRTGEAGGNAAWVPLGTVSDCGLMVLSTPSADADMLTALQTAAVEKFGQGTLISLMKEGTRATMILRWTGLILALWGLLVAARWYGGFVVSQWRRIRAEGKKRYTGRLLPYAALQLLPVLLLGAVLIAVGSAIAVLAVDPARIFPEWVPESLGDFSAWAARFRSLTAENAKSVTLKTPELAEVRFWGGLIRWGTVLVLLSQWKGFFPKKKKEEAL